MILGGPAVRGRPPPLLTDPASLKILIRKTIDFQLIDLLISRNFISDRKGHYAAMTDSFQWMSISIMFQFIPFGDSLEQIHDCYSSSGCIAFVYWLIPLNQVQIDLPFN